MVNRIPINERKDQDTADQFQRFAYESDLAARKDEGGQHGMITSSQSCHAEHFERHADPIVPGRYWTSGYTLSVETRGVLELTTSIAATTLRACVYNAIILCSYDGTPHDEVESTKIGLWSGTQGI
jgi:hypothetical protein